MANRTFYVFVHLPSADAPVLAGGCTTIVEEEGENEGKSYAQFAYANSYLARSDAVAIDPFNLPLPAGETRLFKTDPDEGLTVFGAIRDSAPDSWGRGRMTRMAARDLSELEFVLASGEDRSGFLAFGEEQSAARINASWAPASYDTTRYLDLDAMGLIIGEMTDSRITPEKLRQLLLYGSSLGGARPKATIKHDGRIWLAKAPRADDQYNVPRCEYAAMELARRCGMDVPETRVVQVDGRDIYLIERFDRTAAGSRILRHGMVSALSAFGLSDNAMNIKRHASYNRLARMVGEIGARGIEKFDPERRDRSPAATEQRRELFRRIVFNILVANTDDHPRNHALILRDGRWRLSPLYDVQPIPDRASTKYLAMPFGARGGEGTVENLLSKCGDFDLSRQEATEQIVELLDRFDAWEEVFKNAGVPERDLDGYRVTFSAVGVMRESAERERR